MVYCGKKQKQKGNRRVMNIYIYYGLAVLFGVLVGSFLNVLILRIPEGEDFVRDSSHCPNCGRVLQFYELVPIFSWLAQKGQCRGCDEKISIQYPLIEAGNAILWVVLFWQNGFSLMSVLQALVASMLLAISVIDARTMEIAPQLNFVILGLGIGIAILDREFLVEHIIGLFAISVPLIMVFVFTNGQGLGGGDVKLMGTCGLVLGWHLVWLAFVIGCLIGSVVHVIKMKFFDADRLLALGPYLSLGVYISMLWGYDILQWYLGYLS